MDSFWYVIGGVVGLFCFVIILIFISTGLFYLKQLKQSVKLATRHSGLLVKAGIVCFLLGLGIMAYLEYAVIDIDGLFEDIVGGI